MKLSRRYAVSSSPFSVAVFCGARRGHAPEFARAAEELASAIGRRNWRLIYGGGSVGLMGVVADAALAVGTEVIGVLPSGLFSREVAHRGLTALHEVAGMHERKALMAELSDAFVALPGGFGTLDELFEMTTWAQLGIHRKAIAVLDVNGYFGPLREHIAAACAAGFIAPAHAALVTFETEPERLLDGLKRAADERSGP